MPGPLMHQASMEVCKSLISKIGIPVNVGNLLDVVEPDTAGPSHAYNFKSSPNSGTLPDLMLEYCNKIRVDFQNCGKDLSKLNMTQFSRNARFLCHYATDAHTIGQISSEFWGSQDDKFDVICEVLVNKKAYASSLTTYLTNDQINSALLSSMRAVYNKNKDKAKKWNYIFSGDIVSMARNAVKCGGEFAASWIKLAYDTV